MRLLLTHPQVYGRDCSHCLVYLYNEQNGQVETWGPDDLPYERPPQCPAPCRTNQGCPKGTPEEPLDLSEQHLQALLHYQECRAVNQFPDDSIVRQNAAVIHQIHESQDKLERLRLAALRGFADG